MAEKLNLGKVLAKIISLIDPATGIFVKKDGDTMTGDLTMNHGAELKGNASTATKATQDGSGNTITSTYVSKIATSTEEMSTNLKVKGSNKYLQIGPQNASYAHYYTDATSGHYFNSHISVNGDCVPYGTSNSHSLGSASAKWKLNGNIVADTIIEVGSVDAPAIPAQSALAVKWYYYKFASGGIIAYGGATWTGAISTAWGNLYEGSAFRLALPQALSQSTPIGMYQAHSYDNETWLGIQQSGNYTVSPILYCLRPVSAASHTYYIKAVLYY